MNFDISPAWAKLEMMLRGLLGLIPNLVVALIIFAAFVLAARWIKSLIHKFCERRGHLQNFALVIGRVGSAVTVLFGLLVSLSVILPSFRAADLIQVLGLSSVAIGFAFRDVLQNFLAGILILLAQPFRVGEEVSVQGYEGVVMAIEARATLIKTWDGFLIVIPNSIIYTQSITIFNAYDVRRTRAEFVIGNEADPDRARDLIFDAVSQIDGVLQDPPPNSRVIKLADNGVLVEARWWTDTKKTDYVAVRDRVIPSIKRKLTENGIDLPFPIQQILLTPHGEAAADGRDRGREEWPAAGTDRLPPLNMSD